MYEVFSKLLHINGVTPYKVSKETGISQSSLSDWKMGRVTPKSDTMKKLADYFNVSVDYLMTGVDEVRTQEYYLNDKTREIAQFMFENPKYAVLFDASRKVKEEDIDFVKEMIERVGDDV